MFDSWNSSVVAEANAWFSQRWINVKRIRDIQRLQVLEKKQKLKRKKNPPVSSLRIENYCTITH